MKQSIKKTDRNFVPKFLPNEDGKANRAMSSQIMVRIPDKGLNAFRPTPT